MKYDLTFLAEASGKKKMSKEDKIVQKDYDQFRAHNLALAKKLPKGMADDQGLTGKGGALIGAGLGALGGIAGGPAGMIAGAAGGAAGFGGGTKLGRYITDKVYGKYKHKGDTDW